MKIRAIRVAEIGPFSKPVALEGFTGALDVLTGPNELGKSTLFTALSTLLTEKHTSTSQALGALRPDAGGAPLIEADIELAGRLLRIRKRYLAQRTAELTDLSQGGVLRGADAENEIESLFGSAQLRALRGLVWVRQGESFDLPERTKPGPLAASLAEIIEREAADTAGAGRARRLAAEVRARLGELVTAKTEKAKAGSAYALALRRREELTQALAAARAKFEAAETRRTRLDELRAEQSAYASATLEESLAAEAARTDKAVAEAGRARERLRLADERIETRQKAVDQARKELEQFRQAQLDLDRLAAAVAASQTNLDQESRRAQALQSEVAAAKERRDHLAGQLEDCRRNIAAAQARVLDASTRRTLADLDERLQGARQSQSGIDAAARRIAASTVTVKAVEALAAWDAKIANLDARISAEAPRAAIAYLPGSKQRLRIRGREIADGEPFRITERTEIHIEGLGTLTIEPGDGDGRALLDERDAARKSFQAELQAIGVTDLAAARDALAARRTDESNRDAARTRLAALAPTGIPALEAARETAAAQLSRIEAECAALAPRDAATAQTTLTVPALEQQLRALQIKTAEAVAAFEKADAVLRDVHGRIAIDSERQQADRRRMAEIESNLPLLAERQAHLARKEAEHRDENSRLADAVRERSAWADAVPDQTALQARIADAERAASAVIAFNQRRLNLQRDIAELEGAMQRDGEEGVGTELARLEEELSAARERVADFELDARALGLLADRLERIGTQHRTTVLRPLLDRLQPLLAQLFPDARVALEGPLLVARLERDRRIDTMSRLSGGTREQIAILVRIAHASLLAANGTPLPLVLDDALVYSDDTRLSLMIDALAAASRRHQVILLSCHQRALEPLLQQHGARSLELAPWLDGDVATSGQRTRSRALAAT